MDAATLDAESADLALLSHESETELVKLLLRFPEEIAASAEAHTPHAVCAYLEEVAGAVNSWYHAGNRDASLRVIGDAVSPEQSRARLVLSRAVQVVLRNGLAVLGITAPERMDRAEARREARRRARGVDAQVRGGSDTVRGAERAPPGS